MTWIITLIAGFGLPRPLAAIVSWAIIALAISGTAFAGYELIKHWGADELRAKIEKENQDAIHKGIEASRNWDECDRAGGLWDFRRQRCSSSPRGDR